MKLYEKLAMCSDYPFELDGVKLTFRKFNMDIQVSYEKQNLPIDKLIELLGSAPATYLSEIAFNLLIEKDEFNNDISIFRQCIGPKDFMKLQELIYKIIFESAPKEEDSGNAQSATA